MYSPKKLFQAAICLLAVAALFIAVPFAATADDSEDIPAPTGEGHTLYLKPNENWLSDEAWFALYFFDYNDNYDWALMTDEDGDGIYEAVLPQQFPNFLFYRMDSAAGEFDGEYVLNQTDCFEYAPEYSCYVLEEDSWELGQWEIAEPAEAEESAAETEAPTEEPVAETDTPTEEPESETEVPAEEPESEIEAPAEEPESETEAPTEEPVAETEAPAEEPEVETEAPAEE